MKTLKILILLLLIPCTALSADRIYPSDVIYSGAFKVPYGVRNGASFEYGSALPLGMGWDSAQNALIIQGQQTGYTAYTEVVAPATPVISATKDSAELNQATTLAGYEFVDITDGIQGSSVIGGPLEQYGYVHLRDVEYLPAQGSQTEGVYHWVMGHHYATADSYYNRLGWANTDFSSLTASGPWGLDGVSDRRYDQYMFKIPETWADTHVGGKYLGVGRARTNGSFGPSLYATAPWTDGNPPATDSDVSTVKELIYYDVSNVMQSFSVASAFNDAVWVESGTKAAWVVYANMSYRHEANCNGCNRPGTDRWWQSSGTGRSVGYKDKDVDYSYLSAAIDDTVTTISFNDISIFSAAGAIKIGTEIIEYTGKSGSSLTGCTRGARGTTAASYTTSNTGGQIMEDIYQYGSHVDGYDAVVNIPMLLFYDVDQIAEIATGTRQGYDIQPYAYMMLETYYWNGLATQEESSASMFHQGITTDGSGNIYIAEFQGIPADGKYPLIHQFAVGAGIGVDSTAPSAPGNVAMSSGTLSWSASDEEVVYVVFKYFENVYKDLSEYRPIATVLDTDWVDPQWSSEGADQYKIVAHDLSMNSSDGATGEPVRSHGASAAFSSSSCTVQ